MIDHDNTGLTTPQCRAVMGHPAICSRIGEAFWPLAWAVVTLSCSHAVAATNCAASEGSVPPPRFNIETFTDPLRSGEAGPVMAHLAGGPFRQGATDEHGAFASYEAPSRPVSVQPFAIGVYEVSQAEFARFVLETGYVTDAELRIPMSGYPESETCPAHYLDDPRASRSSPNWRTPVYPQDPRHPVTCVSWRDAKAYVAWLSVETGQRYRLPSESELEYAIRAGGRSRWPWGDDGFSGCEWANYIDESLAHVYSNQDLQGCDDGYVHTAPVGSFTPNAFGLYDTAGNVSEWTEDCYSTDFREAPVDGRPQVGGDCSSRAHRGGSWAAPANLLRSAARLSAEDAERDSSIGFRVARDVSTDESGRDAR